MHLDDKSQYVAEQIGKLHIAYRFTDFSEHQGFEKYENT